MRILTYLLTGLSILILIKCSATIPGGIVDSTAPVNQGSGYEILGESSGSSNCIYLFGLQLSPPNMDTAIREAIDKFGGDELIEVTWYHTFTNYYLFQSYKFTVNGTVIKRKELEIGDEGRRLSQRPIGLQPRPSEPKTLKGNNLSLGFVSGYKGTFTGENYEGEYWYYNPSTGKYEIKKRDKVEIKDYKGWSILYRIKKPNDFTYFSPYVGLSNFTKNIPYNNDKRYFIRTLSLGANYVVNFSKSIELPASLHPYLEGGLGLAWASHGIGEGFLQLKDWQAIWHWFRLGLNLGIGTEYDLNENLAIDVYISYHNVLIDFGVTSGYSEDEWGLGQFGKHLTLWSSGKEKLTDHYFRLGVGLTFK